MGNNTSNQVAKDEIDLLVKDITKIAKELLNKYEKNFLNREFCRKLEIVFRDRLSELSLEKLNAVHNKMENSSNKKLDMVLKYHSEKEDERYYVAELQERLLDLFHDKYVEFKDENLKLAEYMGTQKYVQTGGQHVLSNVKNELETLMQGKKNTNTRNKNNSKNENELDKEIKKENREYIANIFREAKGELPKVAEVFSSKKLETRWRKKENKNRKMSPNEKQKPNQQKKTNHKTNQKENKNSWVNDLYRVSFDNCVKSNGRCYLTKHQICQAIAKNYLMRANIMAVIMTALPAGDNRHGFCGTRLKSLQELQFCLPPNLEVLRKMEKNEKLRTLYKYINQMDAHGCAKINGQYRVLTAIEKQSLAKSQAEHNRFYWNYTQKLEEQYKTALLELREILKILQQEDMISNKRMNAISLKVKDIIDRMYTQCQANYVYAILAFLNADLSATREMLVKGLG